MSTSAVISLTDNEDDEEDETDPAASQEEADSHIPHRKASTEEDGRIYFFDYEEWISNITKEEKAYHKEHMLSSSQIEDTDVVCTACSKQLNVREEGGVVGHPCLGVPLCLQCHSFYGDGRFSQGDDGYFEFCRWCANGGDVLCCDKCPNVFCRACIGRNLGRRKLSQIEESNNWECFLCNPEPVWSLRNLYHSIWINRSNLVDSMNSEVVRSSFIEDALRDGHAVNKIFRDYLDKANSAWSRKANTADEQENVKMVKKIRTILSVAHHNLTMLEQNLVDGIQKKYPHLDPNVTKASGIPNVNKTPETKKVVPHNDNESQDMFEEEDSENNTDQPAALNRSLTEANKRAREIVLNSSSDDDVIQVKTPEETPRKKLKTKKELNGLRQRNKSLEEDEDSSGGEGDSDMETPSEFISNSKKLIKKLNKKVRDIDPDDIGQLKKTVCVDIRNLGSEIRVDLNDFDAVG